MFLYYAENETDGSERKYRHHLPVFFPVTEAKSAAYFPLGSQTLHHREQPTAPGNETGGPMNSGAVPGQRPSGWIRSAGLEKENTLAIIDRTLSYRLPRRLCRGLIP
jgi:hypothetical protein